MRFGGVLPQPLASRGYGEPHSFLAPLEQGLEPQRSLMFRLSQVLLEPNPGIDMNRFCDRVVSDELAGPDESNPLAAHHVPFDRGPRTATDKPNLSASLLAHEQDNREHRRSHHHGSS